MRVSPKSRVRHWLLGRQHIRNSGETARAIEEHGVEKAPLSVAAGWTDLGHPNSAVETIALLMGGERMLS